MNFQRREFITSSAARRRGPGGRGAGDPPHRSAMARAESGPGDQVRVRWSPPRQLG
jgi:hypothetical protein